MFVTRPVPWMVFALVTVVSSVTVQDAHAIYPTNKCVSSKMNAAAKKCHAFLNAYSKFQQNQDAGKLSATLASASSKFSAAWAKADAQAARKDVDCADTTASAGDVETMIDTAVSDFVSQLNATMMPASDPEHAKCASKVLKAAAKKCKTFLQAEKNLIKQPTTAGTDKRDRKQATASDRFTSAYLNADAGDAIFCPTSATVGDLEGVIDTLNDDIVRATTVSPNVNDAAFTTITIPAFSTVPYKGEDLQPICSRATPYSYFVKRGSLNKLLVYFQGGGACWDFLTCNLANTFDADVNPGGSDNPNNAQVGLGNQSNVANPFKDWNVVFVSYCTGDIHFGESLAMYQHQLGSSQVYHYGYVNARVAEKFAREHFLNPDEVFVTGSSAGAYGALFNGPLLRDIYPAAKFSVLGDAGNGVVTQQFLDEKFPVWNFAANLPNTIPGLAATLTNGTGIPGYTEIVANHYSDVAWAHYTTAFDGGTGGQTGFYNIMLNPTTDVGVALAEWPTWWEASCAWNGVMKQQAVDTAAAIPSNYRYYIGSGSRHTMFGSNKVYTDTTGGVPTIVDWINAMRDRSGAWTNVLTTDEGILLAGDPRQNGNAMNMTPPPAPFVDVDMNFTADRIVCP